MKYCRFQLNGQPQYGLVETVSGVEQITRLLLTPPEEAGGDMEDLATKRMDHLPLAEARLLAPVRPSKIVCIGRNYREHAAELGHAVPAEPLIFLKPPSSLLAPGQQIRRPKISQRVDYEGELGVVIGKKCYKIPGDEDVRPYILGYTCGNDVSARDIQQRDRMWPARSKSFDTFAPVGPWIETTVDPGKLQLRTRINGQMRQNGNTADMVFGAFDLVSFLSHVMTLEPGDCIFTGTPAGVSPIKPGDRIEAEIEGIGILANDVRADSP